MEIEHQSPWAIPTLPMELLPLILYKKSVTAPDSISL